MGDAFHQVSVAYDGISEMVDDFVSGSIEGGGQETLCNGHAHPVGKALAQRPRGRLCARSQTVLRMAGGFTFPLPEVQEFREREVVSREMEETVKKHGSMAGGKDEPVAVDPGRKMGIELRGFCPEHITHGCGTHRQSRVP